MKLSKETTIRINDEDSNIIGHECYAAYKLWNVCNYERKHYEELGFEQAPNWYTQKKEHKDDLWYKNLPSQSAQEVCKVLDKSWASFYALKETGGIENPHPPHYKQDPIPVTYMQGGIKHEDTGVRLTISKQLKKYMSDTYDINKDYIYLKNDIFDGIENIKQLKIYPPKDNTCRIIIVYEIEDPVMLPDNGKYLGIDLGVHNFMTCYDTTINDSFIVGRKYLSIARKYDKEISHVQSEWYRIQDTKGAKHHEGSKHIQKLYQKKNNCINDYLHKVTRYLADYCKANDIHTVVVGDITNIRKGKDFGEKTNQKFHGLPYKKIVDMLSYKLALYGITLIKQKESYSSQCAPDTPSVLKKHAVKSNRKHRGLYVKGSNIWNADSVGAYNILRLYFKKQKISKTLPLVGLSSPKVINVAA